MPKNETCTADPRIQEISCPRVSAMANSGFHFAVNAVWLHIRLRVVLREKSICQLIRLYLILCLLLGSTLTKGTVTEVKDRTA